MIGKQDFFQTETEDVEEAYFQFWLFLAIYKQPLVNSILGFKDPLPGS